MALHVQYWRETAPANIKPRCAVLPREAPANADDYAGLLNRLVEIEFGPERCRLPTDRVTIGSWRVFPSSDQRKVNSELIEMERRWIESQQRVLELERIEQDQKERIARQDVLVEDFKVLVSQTEKEHRREIAALQARVAELDGVCQALGDRLRECGWKLAEFDPPEKTVARIIVETTRGDLTIAGPSISPYLGWVDLTSDISEPIEIRRWMRFPATKVPESYA